MRSGTDFESSSPGLRNIEGLLSPYGLVSRTAPLPTSDGEPAFAVHVSQLGDPSKVLPNLRAWSHTTDMGNVNGVGSALTRERARLISIAEALERYSTCAWDEEKFVLAAENELGEEFVSPDRWPRCSAREFSRADCRLEPYDPAVPIRWVRAWSLTRRRTVLVPAVAVYLHMTAQSGSERFARGVTTGAAVHTDMRSAVLGGLLEVIERDALSLAWLQRLRLPRVHVDPELLEPYALACHTKGTAHHLEVRIFDATTDFGVPVLYAVQLADSDAALAQIVCATCELDPQRALAKIYRELTSLRIALREYVSSHPVRRPEEGAVSVIGGAAYNASIERRGAFGHLLDGARETRGLEALSTLPDGADPLRETVSRLAARGAEVLAVDLTTDEARQVGMHAVKVLVPEAVPLSFVHSERYLATERLYTAPKAMGLESHEEASLNADPQPFA